MTKTQSAILLLTAVLALSSCGKPQAVSDLKSAIARLKLAGEQGQPAGYDALLRDAQEKFNLAKSALSGEAAAAATAALARASDAEQVWHDTEVIEGGLAPQTAAPLKRLGVVKDDTGFRQRSDIFLAFAEDPDDDTPNDVDMKKTARDEARGELVKDSLSAAAKALGKAENAL